MIGSIPLMLDAIRDCPFPTRKRPASSVTTRAGSSGYDATR